MFSHDNKRLDDSIDPDKDGRYLTEVAHAPKVSDEPDTSYLKLKVPGDGNCGFYSLGISLINLIVQNQINFTEEQYLALWGSTSEEKTEIGRLIQQRIEFYENKPFEGENKYRVKLTACVSEIKKIFDTLTKGELNTFKQFKDYLITNNAYHQVLAMMIFLGPYLRQLSVNLAKHRDFKNLNQHPHAPEIDIAEIVSDENQDVDVVQLAVVANYFNLSIRGYDTSGKLIYPADENEIQDHRSDNSEQPNVNIIRIILSQAPRHWDILLNSAEFRNSPYYLFFRETRFVSLDSNDEINYPELDKQAMLEKDHMNQCIQHINTFSTKMENLNASAEKELGIQFIELVKTHLNVLFLLDMTDISVEKRAAIVAINEFRTKAPDQLKNDTAFLNIVFCLPHITTANEALIPILNAPTSRAKTPNQNEEVTSSPLRTKDADVQDLKKQLLASIEKLHTYGKKREDKHVKGIKATQLATDLKDTVDTFFENDFTQTQYEDFKKNMLSKLDPLTQSDVKIIISRRPQLKVISLNIALALLSGGLLVGAKLLYSLVKNKKPLFFNEKGRVIGQEKIENIKNDLNTLNLKK